MKWKTRWRECGRTVSVLQ